MMSESDTTCLAPDCTKPRWGRKDYCRTHQERLNRNGTLEKKKTGPAPTPPRFCMVKDCGRPHKGYGYCAGHLREEQLAGRLMDNKGVCGFVGCGRPHHANGLCNDHDRQRRKRGELKPIAEYVRQGEVCEVEGCGEPPQSKNLCAGHYMRRLEGRPLDSPLRRYKERGGECEVEKCDREATVEGMCQTHRRRFLAGAEPGWDDPIPEKAPNGTGHINKDGYRIITVNGRPKREHHHVFEQLIGRRLIKNVENVHHVNGDRADNRVDGPPVIDERGRLRSGNLELWSSAQPKGQEIGPKLAWARQMLELYADYEDPATV